MGSTSLTTVQVTTTVAGALTTYAMTTSTEETTAAASTGVVYTSEETTTAASAGVVYTTAASNGTLAVTATPTAITFTGAAPGRVSTIYGTAMGCVVGLTVMLLL
jgi:hypothetical protein